MRKIWIFLMVFCSLSCWNTSIEETYYPNGSVEKRIVRKNDYQYCFEKFFENNNLKATGCLEYGELKGVTKAYFENGQIETVSTFENGKIIGVQKTYFPNGDINEHKYYLNGKYYYVKIFEENKFNKEHIIPLISEKNRGNDKISFDVSIPFNDSLDYYNSYVDVYYKFSEDSIKWGDDLEKGVFRFDKAHNYHSIEYSKDTSGILFLKTLSVVNSSEVLGYLKVHRIRG